MKNIKIILALILVFASLLVMSACGDDNVDPSSTDGGNDTKQSPDDTKEPSDPKGATTSYVFKSNGTDIVMNADADPIISALGEPKSTYEAPSCAFLGNDYYYDYGSFEVSAYSNGDGKYIYSVYLKDDLVETPEGICIGSSEADVAAAYGDFGKNDKGNYVFSDGNCELSIIITDGKVSSIEYTAVIS